MGSYAAGLAPRIRRILAKSDLSTVSAKAIRKQLVADGEDADEVKENRKEIDELIAELYDEVAGGEEEEEEESEPEVKPKAKGKKQVESDAAMAKRLQAEENGSTRKARAAAPKKKATPKKKTKKRSASDVEDSDVEDKPKKRGGGGAFNKELVLSPALSSFLHEERLSRPQTVKRIWDYIKEHNLQDPNDRRFILCDDTLKTVFKTDKLHMFTMNKLLGEHFSDPDKE